VTYEDGERSHKSILWDSDEEEDLQEEQNCYQAMPTKISREMGDILERQNNSTCKSPGARNSKHIQKISSTSACPYPGISL
jgi:hypothetical protein